VIFRGAKASGFKALANHLEYLWEMSALDPQYASIVDEDIRV
jgi:hypothetical protein